MVNSKAIEERPMTGAIVHVRLLPMRPEKEFRPVLESLRFRWNRGRTT